MSDNTVWLRIPRAVTASVSLDRAPFGVVWADHRGHLGYANDWAREHFELGSSDLTGCTVFDLITAWSATEWHDVIWERAAKGVDVEATWHRPSGGSHVLRTHLVRMQVAGLDLVSIYFLSPGTSRPKSALTCDRLLELAELIPQGLAILDENLLVLQASPKFLSILGRATNDVTGRPINELLTSASPSEFRWNELTSIGLKNWSFHYISPEGKPFDLITSSMAYSTELEVGVRYLVVIEDKTELTRLKNQLDQHEHSFEHLAANTPGMIYKFVLSADGHAAFPYASPGSREIWEIEPEEVRTDASPILNLIHPDDVAVFQESVMRSAAELLPWEFEGRIITRSGKTKWFHAASRPELGDQGEIVWQGLLMDITHQKQIEEELKAAKLKAESAAQSKANFLANMSHEIRTPMNGVIGMAELLDRTTLEPRQKYYVETIRSSAEVLLTIINDILDLSKIEAGRLLLHPSVFDLRRMLEDVATLLAPRAFERGLEVIVRFDPKAPSQILADGVRLRQVLTNLIGNAIKFTHEGHVLVEVRCKDRQDQTTRLEFSVTDTGIGISPEAMQRIFEKFEQADSSTARKYEGTGLGLTISRQLVEMMGGEMQAESELNRGSRFSFELSLADRDQTIDQTPITHDLSGFRILVVDDHPVNRELLHEVLDDWRVNPYEVESGPAALDVLREAAARSQPFDAAILDYHMPIMDGLALAAAIHAEPEINNLALIMLSSSNFSEDQQRSMAESGVVAQLLKPLRVFQLHQVLTNNLPNLASSSPVSQKSLSIEKPAIPEPGEGGLVHAEVQVLLAEDNEVNIEIARDMLESLGLTVDCAVNGKEAVRLAERKSYQLIFMDCQMPEMDGFEATRRIRDIGLVPVPIIIAMTAYAMSGDRERCLEAGMDDYLPKPVTYSRLRELIEKYTEQIRIRHEQAVNSQSIPIPVSIPCADNARRFPLFELEAGLKVTGGKMDVLKRAINIWSRKLPVWLDDLRTAIQEQNIHAIARVAHTVKGAASNIGALSVAEYVERIEAECQMDNLDAIANLYECLVLECERLSQATASLSDGTVDSSMTWLDYPGHTT